MLLGIMWAEFNGNTALSAKLNSVKGPLGTSFFVFFP